MPHESFSAAACNEHYQPHFLPLAYYTQPQSTHALKWQVMHTFITCSVCTQWISVDAAAHSPSMSGFRLECTISCCSADDDSIDNQGPNSDHGALDVPQRDAADDYNDAETPEPSDDYVESSDYSTPEPLDDYDADYGAEPEIADDYLAPAPAPEGDYAPALDSSDYDDDAPVSEPSEPSEDSDDARKPPADDGDASYLDDYYVGVDNVEDTEAEEHAEDYIIEALEDYEEENGGILDAVPDSDYDYADYNAGGEESDTDDTPSKDKPSEEATPATEDGSSPEEEKEEPGSNDEETPAKKDGKRAGSDDEKDSDSDDAKKETEDMEPEEIIPEDPEEQYDEYGAGGEDGEEVPDGVDSPVAPPADDECTGDGTPCYMHTYYIHSCERCKCLFCPEHAACWFVLQTCLLA